MKFTNPLNDFTAGEWSPKMRARTNTEQYVKSCKKIQNMLVQMQGGAFRRPGTKYINIGALDGFAQASLNNAGALKIIPYATALGNYVLVCTDDLPGPAGSTNYWFIYDVDNHAVYTLTLGTPVVNYAVDDVETMQYEQVGDLLFLTTVDAAPRVLIQTSSTAFTLTTLGTRNTLGRPWLSFPFGPIESDAGTGTGNAITATGTFTVGGTVTLTSGVSRFYTGMEGGNPKNGGLGTMFKLINGSSTGVVTINSITNEFTADAVVLKVIPGASPATFGTASGTGWQMSRWNEVDGYPKAVTSFQGRLIFGGTLLYPNYIWGSKIGNLFTICEIPDTDLSSTVDPDYNFTNYASSNTRAFEFAITAGSTKQIQTMSAQKSLVINASTSEIVAFGSNGALGALDFNFEVSTYFGADYVQSVQCNNYLSFVQRGGRKIRDVIFNFNEDQYKSNDMQFVSDHLTTDGKIKQLMATELLSSVIWARLETGNLIAVTIDRDYNITAWSSHIFGGSYSSSSPECVGMCAIPASESNGQDAAFFLIKRTIDGVTKVYLEKLDRFYEKDEYEHGTANFFRYMDSFIEITNSPAATSVTGLLHLEGESVQVIADGFFLGEKTVSSGEITLENAASDILVGLKYESILIPQGLEFGAQTGSAMGREKRLNNIFVRFFASLGAKYGFVRTNEMYDFQFRENDTPADEPTPLFTGDKYVSFPPGYDRTYEIKITSDYPFPCNVVGIAGMGVTYD